MSIECLIIARALDYVEILAGLCGDLPGVQARYQLMGQEVGC
ncbi:MAG: hypothetical protein ACPGSM_20825 [Thiolinea sp.]